MSDIKSILSKHMPSGCVDMHIEIVDRFVTYNKWFTPTNALPDRLYDICREWADLGLMARKTTPIWKNGSHQGFTVEFMFNPDLNY